MKIQEQYSSIIFLNSVSFSPSSHVRLSCWIKAKKKYQWEDDQQRMSHASLQNRIFFNLLKTKEN